MARVRFGNVATERRETCKGSRSGYRFVGLEHLVPENINLAMWDESGVNTFTKMFHKGDVLFGRRRAYLKKAVIAPFDGICSGDIMVFVARTEYILPELLPFVVQNDAFFDFAVGKSAGSLSPRVSWEYLREYEFELPPMDEQRKLARVLWAVNDTVEAYRRLMVATEELVRGRFVEMFGNPGKDVYGWGLSTLGECCEINPKRPKNMDTNLDYSFVAMPSVSEDGVIDASIYRPYSEVCKGFTYFAENDVLFAKITPCMENGKGGIAVGLKNGVGFGSTEFHVLRPVAGKSNSQWLYVITTFKNFRSNAAKFMIGSGGQRRVPATYLSEYKISLPPYDLQQQFADFVHQTDKSKSALNTALTAARNISRKIISENLPHN